jgi:ureidoglycolate dehydrogenase (NAD+)
MQDTQGRLVSFGQLQKWCINKFQQAGIPMDRAEITTDVLLHANLRGVDSHGVLRMEHYVEKIKQGGINPLAEVSIRNTGPVTAIVDGDDGLGHIAAKEAMAQAINLAKTNGIGVVSVINSSHCGALSYFVEMAAREQLIGIAMTNTDKMVVPYGGSSAYFGTNPMAYGFPAGKNPSIILDMATSSVAYGKILEANHLGQPIPDNWAVDQAGNAITDPHQFAALLPFGGPKGYGLGMVVDIFSGLLTGSPFGPYVKPMYSEDLSQQRKLGHFMYVFDISRFTDPATFNLNINQMIEDIHGMPPAPGFNRVLLPGEPEYLREQQRRQDGIPITEELYNYLSS